jgi:formylglycine-generating enzyme required for sulfatase activity
VLRVTGQGTACRSRFGAEDMIGNLWEMTATWGGTGYSPTTGTPSGIWPVGYGGDTTFGYHTVATSGTTGSYSSSTGLPPMVTRGGAYGGGSSAGAYSAALDVSPAADSIGIGARCCRRR